MSNGNTGFGPFLKAVNDADKEKARLEKLETIAQERSELITETQEIINQKLTKYKRLGSLISRVFEKGAYQQTKEGSDYFFDELNRLNDEYKEVVDELIESYKEE